MPDDEPSPLGRSLAVAALRGGIVGLALAAVPPAVCAFDDGRGFDPLGLSASGGFLPRWAGGVLFGMIGFAAAAAAALVEVRLERTPPGVSRSAGVGGAVSFSVAVTALLVVLQFGYTLAVLKGGGFDEATSSSRGWVEDVARVADHVALRLVVLAVPFGAAAAVRRHARTLALRCLGAAGVAMAVAFPLLAVPLEPFDTTRARWGVLAVALGLVVPLAEELARAVVARAEPSVGGGE